MPSKPFLTNAQCDAFRRMPCNFNDMLRACYNEAWDKQEQRIQDILAKQNNKMPMVECSCGDSYPHNSYGAGYIHACGICPNCYVGQHSS